MKRALCIFAYAALLLSAAAMAFATQRVVISAMADRSTAANWLFGHEDKPEAFQNTIIVTPPPAAKTPAPTVTVTASSGGIRTPEPTPTPTEEPIPTFGSYEYDDGVVNVLFLGIDTAEFRSIEENGFQSDAIVLFSIHTKTGEINMITIPRDTKATFNRLSAKGEIIGEKTAKINAAFSYGYGADKYSYQNSCDAVSRFLGGIPVHYYIGIDMSGIAPLVDAIGGVEMTLEFDYTKLRPRMVKGATLNLTGEEALTYVRQRKLAGMDGSDITRTQRQREFMIAYVKKARSLGVIDLIKSALPTVAQYVDTNLNFQQILALGYIVRDFNFDNLHTFSVSGTWTEEDWVYHPDQEKLDETIREIFYNYIGG